jgi:hypothetical protein
MKRTIASAIALASVLGATSPGLAAEENSLAEQRSDGELSVMLGLHQWLIMGGGNVAAQYKTGRWVFEYSHGQALHLNNAARITLTSEEREAGVRVDMPWTTGGGAGLRLTRNLHALVEVKVHRYEMFGADRNQSLGYYTFTVGPGLFYDIHLWRGLFVQPLVRWWPTVAETLDEDAATGFTRPDGAIHRPRAKVQGLFANVNLGWRF